VESPVNAPFRSGRPDGGGGSGDGGTQTLKAVLLIAVVVIVGILVLAHNPKSPSASTSSTTRPSHSSTTTATTVPHSTTSTTLVPVSSIKLQVLNGTGSGNLATQWSNKLKANPGYATQPPDDATAKVAASEIYVITPGYLPEAYALAKTVGLANSAVVTTIPPPATAPIRTSERTTSNLVLVIGPDLAGSA
jgi:hypothetical protein